MENKRKDLAEALELVGGVFDIDGMAELAAKAEKVSSICILTHSLGEFF